MTKSVNLGIIGSGEIANQHLKVLNKIKFFNLYSITSKTLKNTNYLKKLYKINNIHKSYLSMIMDDNVDCFLICVSPENIAKVLQKVIPTKKPFFTEKPFALNLTESNKILNLLDRYKNINMVGYNRRYYSIFHKGINYLKKRGGIKAISIEGHERYWILKKIIKNKIILKNWIYVNNTHMIDLINFFSGDIKNINYINQNKVYSMNYALSFISKNNIIGTYSSYWNSPGGWSVKLFGDGFTVVFDPLENGKIIDKKFNIRKIKPSMIDEKYKAGFYNQMISYKKLLINKKLSWPACDIKKAIHSMKIANKLTKIRA